MGFGEFAPDFFLKEVFNSEQKTMTTSDQDFDAKKVNVYGHIAALTLKIATTTQNVSDTYTTSVKAKDLIATLTIRDKASKPVISVRGQDLSYVRKILSIADTLNDGTIKKGEFDAQTNIADGSATANMEIPCDINIADQPISVEWTLGNLDDLVVTRTDATGLLTLQILGKSIVSPEALNRQTRRIYSYTRGAVATELELQNDLPTGIIIDNIAILEENAADITDITLKPTGQNIGLDRVNDTYLEEYENRNFWDGHTTALHILPHPPFKVADETLFKINPSTSFTPRLFITHRGAR